MKYRLTDEIKHIDGHTLYRIECTSSFICRGIQINEGMLGGWVETEYNLSQIGECWISADSYVMGSSHVFGNALIDDGSIVIDSIINGNATVNNSLIKDSSIHDSASAIDSNLTISYMFDESSVRGVDVFGVILSWNKSIGIDTRQFRDGHWECRYNHAADILRWQEFMEKTQENVQQSEIESPTRIGNDVEERQ